MEFCTNLDYRPLCTTPLHTLNCVHWQVSEKEVHSSIWIGFNESVLQLLLLKVYCAKRHRSTKTKTTVSVTWREKILQQPLLLLPSIRSSKRMGIRTRMSGGGPNVFWILAIGLILNCGKSRAMMIRE